MKELEEGNRLDLDFGKIAKVARTSPEVIPVAVQSADTNEVILLAYTNRTAFEQTLRTGSLVLWSTSRNELWEKGKTSHAQPERKRPELLLPAYRAGHDGTGEPGPVKDAEGAGP
jgi:hypothetical protein